MGVRERGGRPVKQPAAGADEVGSTAVQAPPNDDQVPADDGHPLSACVARAVTAQSAQPRVLRRSPRIAAAAAAAQVTPSRVLRRSPRVAAIAAGAAAAAALAAVQVGDISSFRHIFGRIICVIS